MEIGADSLPLLWRSVHICFLSYGDWCLFASSPIEGGMGERSAPIGQCPHLQALTNACGVRLYAVAPLRAETCCGEFSSCQEHGWAVKGGTVEVATTARSLGPLGSLAATRPLGPLAATGSLGPLGPLGPLAATGPLGPLAATGSLGPLAATGSLGPLGPLGPLATRLVL